MMFSRVLEQYLIAKGLSIYQPSRLSCGGKKLVSAAVRCKSNFLKQKSECKNVLNSFTRKEVSRLLRPFQNKQEGAEKPIVTFSVL